MAEMRCYICGTMLDLRPRVIPVRLGSKTVFLCPTGPCWAEFKEKHDG